MRQKTQIAADIESTEIAKVLTSTFEEIAAIRMQTIRKSVEETRQYLSEVDTIFRQVEHDYSLWLAQIGKVGKIGKSALRKNGKTIYVLITENGGLYGDLPSKLVTAMVEAYTQHSKQEPGKVDIAVIGSVGEYIVNTRLPKVKIKTFSVNDDHPTATEIADVVAYISSYDSILVVYGFFESLLSIVPKIASISGNAEPAGKISQPNTFTQGIVYEPRVDKIAAFFETTILQALFSQKIFESQLARFATRMVSMDTATQRVEERAKLLQGELGKFKKRIANKKLQELFSGVSQW